MSLSSLPRLRQSALIAAAYLGTFLATISISVVNVALPTLQTALTTDLAGLQWVVNAYAIALSAFMLSAGPLADRYGHKRVWAISIAVFSLGAAWCAVAESLSELLWGRAIQGIAGALLIPSAMPILTLAFPDPATRARVIGGWSAFSALALVLGPLLGGILVEYRDWPSIFWIQVPIGGLALLLGLWGIQEHKNPKEAALDPFGQLLSIIWLAALTYALIRLGHKDFSDTQVQVAVLIAILGCALFIIIERQVEKPLLPLEMVAHSYLGLPNLASFILGFGAYASLFFLSIFIQQAQHQTPSVTGIQLLPQFLLMGGFSMIFGHLLTRWSLMPLLAWGYAAMGVSMTLMFFLEATTEYWITALLLGVLGIGMGIAVPGTALMVMGRASTGKVGSASATMNALRQTGMTLGIAVLGSLMSRIALSDMENKTASLESAFTLAQSAILEQKMPETNTLIWAYRNAMAQGFNSVMLIAGLCTIFVAILLLSHRHR